MKGEASFYNLSKEQFKSLNFSDKKNYVEHLASINKELKEWEINYLSPGSIEKYLDKKLSTTAWMEDYEFHLLTKEQKKKYIQKKKFLTPAEVVRLDSDMQNFFVETIVSGNLSLDRESFLSLSDRLKRKYVTNLLKYSNPINFSALEVGYLSSKQQKEFIDYHIENSISFKKSVINQLSKSALSYYNKKRSLSEVRIVIDEVDDEKVGKEYWFEYHCFESPASCDAEVWYRSHQKVKVLSISEPGGGDTPQERGERGEPRVYKVRFKDGLEWDVFEDELMDSPDEFYRPDPPSRPINENTHLLSDYSDEEIISNIVRKWANWYQEDSGMNACDINTGECMNFAEAVYGELLDDYGIKTEILSDAFFYDSFGDYDPEEMMEPSEAGGVPTFDYKEIGLPSHYWIYHNGKHYDSEVPEGIDNFFEIPTIVRYAKKYGGLKEVRGIVREVLSEAMMSPGGELIDFDIRMNYPYEEIWNLIKDYYEENNKYWMKFGWSVFDAYGSENLNNKYKSDSGAFFRVERLNELDNQEEPVLDYLSSDQEAWEKAREAGFIVDEDGIVLGLHGVNLVDRLNESRKLDVFDFDSTMVDTPMPEDGERETGKKWDHKWWNSPESLDTELYDMKANKDVIKAQKKSSKNKDTKTVMITGRKEKLKKHVNKIIDDLKLDFDQRLFNGGKETSQDKIDKMDKILKDNPDIREVEIWEDRHIDIYTKWGNKKVKDGELDDFKINHIKESIIREISEDVWYHGSPDVRELEKEGGFTQKYLNIDYVDDVDEWNRRQAAMQAAKKDENEDEYFRIMDTIDELRKNVKVKKPIFLTDVYSVARTYADPHRAFDYQSAKEKVLTVRVKPGNSVTIYAPGERFRFIDINRVRRGFINAGVDENELDQMIRKLNYALGVSSGIKTDDVAALGDHFGFDYIDVVGVLDSYHGGTTKSTVRMVFDPSHIEIV